ncbi:MAG TPA: class I SAM-dependent methyltransferase [Mycobacterium sp.]|nr:class I SAM-dependent methyltransferase [Mycobacterium sp.]
MIQLCKPDFRGVAWGSPAWTNLVTLYLRACESRLPKPILGDHAAAEAVDRIDYDFQRMHRAAQPWANQYLVALRARKLDDGSADFLRRHPNAVVLHLGCGMDTRAFRLQLPAGVDWFDVDQPDVIELRRQLFDESDGYHMIGSSVTDAGWLERIPTGRPVLVVAEGLLMYLSERQVWELFQRLTDRFGSGELLFDTLSPMGPRLSLLFTKGIVKWGIRDAREIEMWNPRLRFLEQSSALAGFDTIAETPQRRLYRVLNATPIRRYDVVNRFAF